MNYSSLDTTPKEYFLRNFSGRWAPKKPGAVVWSGLFVFGLFLYLSSMTIHAAVVFPRYVVIVEILIYLYFLVTFILCLRFSRKKRVLRQPTKSILSTALWLLNFPIIFWFFLSALTMLLIGSGGFGKVEFVRGIFVSIWSLIMLGVGAAILVWMRRRMIGRILAGHMRLGGSGFWGDIKWKNEVPKIGVVLFAVSMVLVFISRQASRLGGVIEWDIAYWPLMIIFSSIMIIFFCFIFFYLFTIATTRIYCIKRFGIEPTPTPEIPREDPAE